MQEFTFEESRQWCHTVMKTAARNFYYGMSLLPEAKRNAMFALYAYMRRIDDIADDAVDAGEDPAVITMFLEAWRAETRRALAGEGMSDVMFPALVEAVRRFCIPADLLDAAIDGQLQDMHKLRYGTFEELRRYCYCVASTVGIAAVYIWGFRDAGAIVLADERGVAFQLTNILRDVREDYARGRVYLPQEDLARFGVDMDAVMQGGERERFAALVAFEAARARQFYESSAALEGMVAPDSRGTLRVMTRIYGGILERIERKPLAVLDRRVGLSGYEKMREVARELWRSQFEGDA